MLRFQSKLNHQRYEHVHCTKRYLTHQRAAERRERSTEALAGQEKNVNDNGGCQKLKQFFRTKSLIECGQRQGQRVMFIDSHQALLSWQE